MDQIVSILHNVKCSNYSWIWADAVDLEENMRTKGKPGKKVEKLWPHHRNKTKLKLFTREVDFTFQCLHHILRQLCGETVSSHCTLALDGLAEVIWLFHLDEHLPCKMELGDADKECKSNKSGQTVCAARKLQTKRLNANGQWPPISKGSALSCQHGGIPAIPTASQVPLKRKSSE